MVLPLSGCKDEAVVREGITETMQISPECSADNSSADKCCYDQCIEFCKGKDYLYAKHMATSIKHCACWCG